MREMGWMRWREGAGAEIKKETGRQIVRRQQTDIRVYYAEEGCQQAMAQFWVSAGDVLGVSRRWRSAGCQQAMAQCWVHVEYERDKVGARKRGACR
jgi:hypothetical protein